MLKKRVLGGMSMTTGQPPTDDLFPELAEILLLGRRGAPMNDSDPDPFRIFSYSDADLKRVWTVHRVTLLREWARRGLSGKPWAEKRYDFGEI
jgi:hypothetical protein